MKRLLIAVLALTFMSTSVVFAQDMGQGQGEGKKVGQQKTAVTIDNFDQEASILSYTAEDGSTKEVQVADDVEITGPDGMEMLPSDLQPGMQVDITFTGSKINEKISKIEITEPATEPAPEPEPLM